MLKYYIFLVEWSQSDSDMRVVQAESREAAEKFLKRHGDRGPRYVSCYGEQDEIIIVSE
jgi:hypothetical protein